MTFLQSLLPPHPWAWPMLVAMLIYGVRYLIMAAGAFLIARPTPGGGWGRPHASAPARLDYRRQVRRELLYSSGTVLIFGLINAILFGWGLIDYSLLYYRLDSYPAWWFWLSIALMLLLHDTMFYWAHRAMHTDRLYRAMHLLHHRSVHPTTFTSYSFHPGEALAEALMVTAILFMVPSHPLAFFIFQTISTAYNVYGHSGREFYPRGWGGHWLGRWLNTSTLHAFHHARERANYGLYFLFWDRLMRTLEASKETAAAPVREPQIA